MQIQCTVKAFVGIYFSHNFSPQANLTEIGSFAPYTFKAYFCLNAFEGHFQCKAITHLSNITGNFNISRTGHCKEV